MSTLAQDFTAKWRPIVTPIAQKYGINPDFILTQIAQESWWGTKTPTGSHNYAGIMDFRKKSDGVMASDAGRQRKFRRFADETAFAEHYINMLSRLYPKTVGAKTIDEFTSALQDGPRRYAESTQYKQHLGQIYNQHYANGDVAAQQSAQQTGGQPTATNSAVFTPNATEGGAVINPSKEQKVTDPYEDLWGVKPVKQQNEPWEEQGRLVAGHQTPYKQGNYKFDWGLR